MTKVLYLTPGCFDKGGISRYCRYQVDALREVVGSKDIRVLSLLGPDPEGFETPYPVTWHGSSTSVTKAARAHFVFQSLRQALLWRPDIIHSAHVNFTPLLSVLKAVSGATTVLNVYGLELWSGLTSARRDHMARVDHIIADCHSTADHVIAEAMHPDVPLVIWDCVDLDRFHPGPPEPRLVEHYGLPDLSQHRVVMTLGRLSKAARHKGYDRLLGIWASVCARVPNAHLVICGRGDDVARLKAKTRDLDLSDQVTFTGPIEEKDLASIYRVADVFALVSDKGPGRGEGIPLTPIEALASGVPVVVGDEDGSSEAVDSSRNGLVVSPRDLSAMADAIVKLLSETNNARKIRAAESRAVAEERFGYAAFRDKHAAFYAAIRNPISQISKSRVD